MNLFGFFKRNLLKENCFKKINHDNTQEIKLPPNDEFNQKSESPRYLQEFLPNGNTIVEQQRNDYNIKEGIYAVNTPVIYGMKIISSTVPPQYNYGDLSEEENIFFHAFQQRLIEAKYNPDLVQLTRLSSGTFNVDYTGLCHIGKICLYKTPPTYAVIKGVINEPQKYLHLLMRLKLLLLLIALLKSRKEWLSLRLICNTPLA